MNGRLTKKEITNIIYAFMGTWAVQLSSGMSVRNPLTVAVFILLYFVCCGITQNKEIFEEVKLPLRICSIALAALLSGGTTAYLYKGAAAGFTGGVFRLLTGVILFAGFWSIYLIVIKEAYGILTGHGLIRPALVTGVFDMARGGVSDGNAGAVPKGIIFIFAAICFICWLPYFLYEYPGIMTADSLVQYEQVTGVIPWSNHHPVIHTLCISFFYRIGFAVTGDVNRAVSFYTLAQMLFMSVCCGVTVKEIFMITGRKALAAAALAFYAAVPFNAVFAVTVWKDIPFAGLVMLFSLRLCRMLSKEERTAADYVLLAILSILLSLFRSNAWYAYIVSVPFLIYAFRKQFKAILVSVVATVILVILIKGPVMDRAGIAQPDFTESLSVPLQQVVRVLVNDRELPAKDMDMIDAVIDRTYIHELYAADFADNIKELVRAGHPEVIEENKGAYFLLWLRVGVKYPTDYIRAWFDLAGGYVYPDFAYEVGNIDGIMGNEYGLVGTPQIGGKAVVKGKEILIKLGSFVPLYGMLWAAGTYFWILVFAVCTSGRDDEKRKLLPVYVLPLALTFTLCIAAPVVDFRYAYGQVMTMPLYVAICVMIKRK